MILTPAAITTTITAKATDAGTIMREIANTTTMREIAGTVMTEVISTATRRAIDAGSRANAPAIPVNADPGDPWAYCWSFF